MNDDELKELESKLRSWRPRRPSPAIKWRLFVASVPQLVRSWNARWQRQMRFGVLCLPATACLLLAFLSLNSEPGITQGSTRRELVVQTLSSNQSCVTYLPDAAEQGQNAPLPSTSPESSIFRWTNASGSPSMILFTPSR
jgi:hypothetical protein